MAVNQVIRLSAGAAEYTWPATITERKLKDISAASVVVSIGTFEEPGDTWFAPDIITRPTDNSVMVQVYITNSLGLAVGTTYYLWIKVSDNPEIVPRIMLRFDTK